MNFTSEDFHIQYISTYSLYINTDVIYDQLLVVDDNGIVLSYHRYETEKPSAHATKLLGLPFKEVFISLGHQNLLWIPTEIFSQQESVHMYDSFFDSIMVNPIQSKTFSDLHVTALFQTDILNVNHWKNIFPEAMFLPVFEGVLKQAQSYIPAFGNVLGVQIYDTQIDLFIFMNGAFKFYNTFEAMTVDDLSYFILQLFKNFEIGEKIERIILGGADFKSEWAARLALYTEDLEIPSAQNKWTSSSVDVNESLISLAALVDSNLCV